MTSSHCFLCTVSSSVVSGRSVVAQPPGCIAPVSQEMNLKARSPVEPGDLGAIVRDGVEPDDDDL